ncbi:multicopper oxidase domain-containing protein [Spartinivicinus ruber]|uniref:multicopper oxidase domain-containing protein n=1 Tax=Spartinivicinus ruber TaxID=2683272 RepID=UPI0013D74D89|nr:multicopper oxidase domain-containing protein [Spartinivicinus ruber]
MDRRQFLTVTAGLGVLGTVYSFSKSSEAEYEITKSDNLLFIPPLLYEPLADFYQLPSITVKDSTYSFFPEKSSSSIGLSTNQHELNYLGPTIKVKRGDVVGVTINNQTNMTTMNHWHGLQIPSYADGSPHLLIPPKESWNTTLHIQQEAATCWYHPLNYDIGDQQLYLGYAGLFIIEDDNIQSLNIPTTYGLDDIPLIVQDKVFDNNGQQIYTKQSTNLLDEYTVIVNGTINPYLSIAPGWVRFRLLNASNTRVFDFSFSEQATFYKVASDGGMLNSPVAMTSLTLASGERSEIMIFLKEGNKNIALLATDKLFSDISFLALKITVEDVACTETVLPSRLRPNSLNVNYNLVNTLPVTKQIKFGSDVSKNDSLAANTIYQFNEIESTLLREEDEIWMLELTGNYSIHIYGASFLIISIDDQPLVTSDIGWQDTLFIGKPLKTENKIQKIKLLIKFNYVSYRQGVNRFQAKTNPTSLKFHVPYLYYCRCLDQNGISKIGQFSVSDKV